MYVHVNGKTEYWLHNICHQYENNKVHVSCLIIAGYIFYFVYFYWGKIARITTTTTTTTTQNQFLIPCEWSSLSQISTQKGFNYFDSDLVCHSFNKLCYIPC